MNINNIISSFQDTARFPKQRLPTVIQFPINNICNSRCQMCDIWQQKKGHEITPAELKKVLQNPLFRKVKSIGMNGGEPTLRRDFIELVQTTIDCLPDLRGISLITNGIQDRKIITSIDSFAQVCYDNNIKSDVMVSLDGYGEIHDTVRGRPDNFIKSTNVINHLIENPLVNTKRIGCTIVSDNALHLEKLFLWALEKGVYIKYRLGIPHNRLYSNDERSVFKLSEEKKFHIANFLDYLRLNYEKDFNQREFYLSLRNQLVYGSKRRSGCNWKNAGVTLLSDGGLAYCAVESPLLGNAISQCSSDMYWKNSAVLDEIIKNKCDSCMHDYVGIGDRKQLIKHYLHRIRNKLPEVYFKPMLFLFRLYSKINFLKTINCYLKEYQRFSFKSNHNNCSRILLCGWYGTETLGDKAILSGIVYSLRKHNPIVKIDLASLEPYVSNNTIIQLPDLGISKNLSIDEALKEIDGGKYGHVAMAGGPLMSSITRSLDILHLFVAAKKNGARVSVVGCGLGPFTNDYRDKAIGAILKVSDSIMLRDQDSVEYAKAYFNIKNKISTGIDPAFIWIYESIKKPLPERGNKILFALRDWPVNEYAVGYSTDDALKIKSRFEIELLKFKCLLNVDYTILPFCMHKQPIGGDDRFYHNHLWSDDKEVLRAIDWGHRKPEDDLKMFMSARGVVAMRFHSVVFAIATGTPFIALDYTMGGKISGLLHMLGLQDRLFKVRKFNADEAFAKLTNIDTKEDNKEMIEELIMSTRVLINDTVFG